MASAIIYDAEGANQEAVVRSSVGLLGWIGETALVTWGIPGRMPEEVTVFSLSSAMLGCLDQIEEITEKNEEIIWGSKAES